MKMIESGDDVLYWTCYMCAVTVSDGDRLWSLVFPSVEFPARDQDINPTAALNGGINGGINGDITESSLFLFNPSIFPPPFLSKCRIVTDPGLGYPVEWALTTVLLHSELEDVRKGTRARHCGKHSWRHLLVPARREISFSNPGSSPETRKLLEDWSPWPCY
jgi:hypothetical protein